jgi:hypothetical protein
VVDDEELLRAFDRGTVAKEAWDHRAHLHVAYLLLRDSAFETALDRMRAGLGQLLERFGIEDAIDRGYHETITVAWLKLVASAMRTHGPHQGFDALVAAHPYLLEKRLLRLFYSRERVTSAEAKLGFVDGDITPLP